MNIEELEADLPNGLHDAVLRTFSSDPAERRAEFILDVWLGDLHSSVPSDRERYRSARLELLGLVYLVIDDPGPRQSERDGSPVQIDSCAADDDPVRAGQVPQGGFAGRFFVTEWNAFIHFAALDVRLTWTEVNWSSTALFAGKAEQYARHRADYPSEVIEAALTAIQLQASDVVADVGSGTGMLARWILERGNQVFGVEPDEGMRAVAERQLARDAYSFTSVAGVAEATTLPDASVDVIVTGNAFHYFDPVRARAEADRLLRRPGRVLVVRHADGFESNAFMRAYGPFLKSIAAKASLFHQPDRYASSLRAFFGGVAFEESAPVQLSLPMSWDALSGRFGSTSVMPLLGDSRRPQVLAGLRDLFDAFAVDGTVEFQLGWQYAWGVLRD